MCPVYSDIPLIGATDNNVEDGNDPKYDVGVPPGGPLPLQLLPALQSEALSQGLATTVDS